MYKELGGLVGDIAATYGQHFKDMFANNDKLNYLVNSLMNADEEEARALSDFVIGEVKKVIN